MNLEDHRKYTYTFYHLYDTRPQESSFKRQSSYYSNTSPYKPTQSSTAYSHNYSQTLNVPGRGEKDKRNSSRSPYKPENVNSPYNLSPSSLNVPLKSEKQRKLSSTYSSAMNARQTSHRSPRQTDLKSPEVQVPITYPYKNPGCGINMTGKAKFQMRGDDITVKIDKVLNSRKGGKSGTLQLQLIKMSYFYDGMSGMRPEQYTSVGTASLGQLQGGWSFSDIVRVMEKKRDDNYSYRRCYILLLEEWDETQFKIVDYMNFD